MCEYPGGLVATAIFFKCDCLATLLGCLLPMSEQLIFSKDPLCRESGGSEDGWYLLSLLQSCKEERWLELGAGCGEIALLAAARNPSVCIDALEVQPELVGVAQKNIQNNGLANRVTMIQGDVRCLPSSLTEGSYDQIFCNPPFFLPQAGRVPKKKSRAIARFELLATLADFLKSASRLLCQSGQLHLVHRPERLVEILTELSCQGLNPFRLIPIHRHAKGPARLILVSARKGGRAGMKLEFSRLG